MAFGNRPRAFSLYLMAISRVRGYFDLTSPSLNKSFVSFVSLKLCAFSIAPLTYTLYPSTKSLTPA